MTKGKTKSFKGFAIMLGVVVGLLAIAGIAYAIDVAQNQGKIPRATSVGGVDISSMERQDALDRLTNVLGSAEDEPVLANAGEAKTEFVPSAAGLSLNLEETIAAIPDETLNPFSRLYSFFRSNREVEVKTDQDENQLGPELDRMVGELYREPEDGGVSIDNGEVQVRDAVLGQEVDRGELEREVGSSWLDPDGVEVEAAEVEPVINQDKVDEVAQGPAAQAVSGPLTVEGREDISASIEPENMGEIVHFMPEEGELRGHVDVDKAQGMLAEPLQESESPLQNARLSFVGGARQVTPHVDGEIINWEETLSGLHQRVFGEERTWEAVYKDEPATFTTADAENATFNQVVGEFTTGGYSEASGKNIQTIASRLNGIVVSPGETFSVNQTTGPRTAAQGYVDSGVIIDGRPDEAVGGGISQYATTLYNASYFAGMEDVAHTPHSYYISRYPAGREATLYDGAIDLQFRNNSQHPVRIESSVGGGSVTVRLMGVKEFEVESISGGRWGETEPERRTVDSSDCIPSSGTEGFSTSDTRVIRTLAGQEISRETSTTVYDPQPIISCS